MSSAAKAPLNVFIVSKPLIPPWSDSSKNLAHDIILHTDPEKVRYTVLGGDGFDLGLPHVRTKQIFSSAGRYQPGLVQNLRTCFHLLRQGSDVDIFHFFYAPNPLTSFTLKVLMKFKKQKTVHTLCSRPRDFASLTGQLYADSIVALSEETRQKIAALGRSDVVRIPPVVTVDPPEKIASLNISRWAPLRARGGAVILYAGDYEYSGGHDVLLKAMPAMLRQDRTLTFVFACRNKTKQAAAIEAQVRSECQKLGILENMVFLNEVDDMKLLIRACDLTVLPARSLFRKMDIPLVLLESLALERPVIVSDLPPLKELVSSDVGFAVDLEQPRELELKVLELARDKTLRERLGKNGRALVERSYNASRIASQYEALYEKLGPIKRHEDNRKYYDQFSATYEKNRYDGYHKLIDDLEAAVVKNYGIRKGILEVGCGTGLVLSRMREYAARVRGIDLSEAMLRRSLDKGLEVVQGSATHLPFQDGSFDTCVSFKVLPHVRDLSRALREMARVTKKGGYVLAEFYNATSIRGLRWLLRKKFFSRKEHASHITEKEIYTKYHRIRELQASLPPELECVDIRGVITWTPFAFFHKLPIFSRILDALEARTTASRFHAFAGFIILILKKK